MDTNRIWNLLGKKLSGEASDEELRELETILDQGLGDIYPIHILEKLWQANPANPPLHVNKALNDKWLRFESRLKTPEANTSNDDEIEMAVAPSNVFKRLLIWGGSIAAAALLCIGIFWFAASRTIAVDNRITQINAPKGSISKIILPDGTKVWLNGGSRLVYQNQFGNQFRKVTLTGEAFFDVVKDAAHPFIVTTSTFQLKVLGTAFNVRSYPNDKTSEAALVRGKIQIRLTKNPDKEITLLPSERLVVKNTETPAVKTEKAKAQFITQDIPLITLSNFHQSAHDTLPSEALWMENKLAFDAENFEEIANKMERWFSVHVEFKNNHAKQLRFTGEFKNESLYQTLASLQQTAPFHYTIKDNNVFIY
jgi:ferric-dicitrate binding protein FerR (iron transport regulator)